jgi:diguanylate cyclase (GGDEF)-like protein
VIVDDDDLSLRLFASIADEIPDVIPHAFLSSTKALEWCQGKDVDCFILDYHQPTPDGLEMIDILRATDAFALVPIVIVTGEGERDVRYRAFDAGANDFVQKPVDYRELVARVNTLLSLQMARKLQGKQIGSLEFSLIEAEASARRHAERLESLWRIINNPSLRDEDLILAMLRQAASAIQPGQVFRGNLLRIQGSDLIVEAVTYGPGQSAPRTPAQRQIIPLKGSLVEQAIADGGGPHSWDNIEPDQSPGPGRSRVWRAHLMTTFVAGGATWVLSFRSNDAAFRPFGKQEHTYIEILASFFANHFQQRWQFDRIQYQQSHDALTGLLNRSQFRSQARAAVSTLSERFAIILVDINALREVNKSYGHMIGDALLVEVGNALRQRAADEEIVGRIAGDVFGIYVPDPTSRDFVRRRTLEFAETFAHGFSTGDREGKEFISLTASFGIAVAPEDGTKFDTILSHADAALLVAKARGPGSIVCYELRMAALPSSAS